VTRSISDLLVERRDRNQRLAALHPEPILPQLGPVRIETPKNRLMVGTFVRLQERGRKTAPRSDTGLAVRDGLPQPELSREALEVETGRRFDPS
jgi:hypothetical protein